MDWKLSLYVSVYCDGCSGKRKKKNINQDDGGEAGVGGRETLNRDLRKSPTWDVSSRVVCDGPICSNC